MGFTLNSKEYFNNYGVDVMAFSDFYPEGHQSGVSLIMNDRRAFSNGDIRIEQTPGQWQPIPHQQKRVVDVENQTITTTLGYPDMDKHLHGFNPMIYPDLEINYDVIVSAKDSDIHIVVNLDRPVPSEFLGKLCFNIELFPGALFGHSYICDGQTGIFPRQPNGPTQSQTPNIVNSGKMRPRSNANACIETLGETDKGFNPIIADDIIAKPYASGYSLTVCPEDDTYRFTLKSLVNPLKLYDGRMNHNNGWFVVNCEIPADTTKEAIHLILTPAIDTSWIRKPVVQISQVGYHPDMPKTAVIELDARDSSRSAIILEKLNPEGFVNVLTTTPDTDWGHFLRYNYITFDFSQIKEEGLYRVNYNGNVSSIFRIASDVYERGVWQPVLEYFLPVQMCHMRVNEKYRVWHGLCHCDDARMAPTNYEHFDGAAQGPSTLTKFKPGDHIPGLTHGGWHDAGDFDLRIESQTGEIYNLATAFEEFDVYLDSTTIDQVNRVTEIHQPDGKNDILQQIEHGALSIIGAYKSLGRLYHEIMCPHLRQYVLLGDPVNMTTGVIDNPDERLLFTEDNPDRELMAAAHLSGASRALRGYNDELAQDCLNAAIDLVNSISDGNGDFVMNAYDPLENTVSKREMYRIYAYVELFLSTRSDLYKEAILARKQYIIDNISSMGTIICRAIHQLDEPAFTEEIRTALFTLKAELDEQSLETPYGIPYKPNIWGAGWAIQDQGAKYYYLHKAFPDIFGPDYMYNALNFVLGTHPGTNTQSFASGIGTESVLTGYGLNRADWSYIPGGVSSGTALIRPDLPELLEFPYLWQQKEYVIGGGSTNYLFLVLAVRSTLNV